MANLIISAKSGRGWALNELVYFKIEIETVPALDFFKTAQLPTPTVPAAIMNNVELPAGPLPHDARLFFGYLEDAMTGEESMVVDFSAFLLRLLAFDEPDRLIHCRKELSFEMCGSHVDARADVCVVSQVGHHYLFLIQEDKCSIDAEPQLIAETIAAVYQNNRSRIVAGLPTLQQMVIPGLTMRGATPIFFKIPITQDLITSVALGCRPEQSTVIHRCIPPVPRPATYVREGMKPLDNRRIVLQCLEAFKAFLDQWL